MARRYIAYHFTVNPFSPGSEILIAQLGEAGFESFEEGNTGITAYIASAENHADILAKVDVLNDPTFEISYTSREIQAVNWNEAWEKNFSPIVIENTCTVRAPFHSKPKTQYDIIIEPKMSFGTGHHATTHLMIKFILREQWNEKSVLDMGCGTGVLAILIEMKGAKNIDAIDIDNWCYQNTLENVKRNNCTNIQVYEGDTRFLKGKAYDSIIANINRNILLQDMNVYAKSLRPAGSLFLSGFYKKDLDAIRNCAKNLGLRYIKHLERESWVAVKFVK